MRQLLVAFVVLAMLGTAVVIADEAKEESPIISITRSGNGPNGWTVDKEGTWTNWFVITMGKRPNATAKLPAEQFTELKKLIESVKWADVKEKYADEAAKDAKAAVVCKVVVVVKDKPVTVEVTNPETNKAVPEGIAKACKLVMSFTCPEPKPEKK